MNKFSDEVFHKRYFHSDPPREDDERDEYMRDKARIVHSAAFRRLQGKTQVMGAGEGDFHRTRLTHSLEVAQIGQGAVKFLTKENNEWLPDQNLISAACYAHDLGHPPFGHGGEMALQSQMLGEGGFEGNAQTLRLLTKLEKYHKYEGVNPTRRTLLSILKYPVCYKDYDENNHKSKPPKCYYQTEEKIVDWCLEPFSVEDKEALVSIDNENGKPKHKSFDASIMEQADDIAYASHDVEDAVARGFIDRDVFGDAITEFLNEQGVSRIGSEKKGINANDLNALFKDSYERKRTIGKLVNLFITSLSIKIIEPFEHPLLSNQVVMQDDVTNLLNFLNKKIVKEMVIKKAELQMLERKGKRLVVALFKEMIDSPKELIPTGAWRDLDPNDTEKRRVCDFIAGMTDEYAEKIYHRLFTPGYGSSRDEL